MMIYDDLCFFPFFRSLSLSLPFVCMSSCLAFVALFPSLLSAYIYVNLQYVVVVLPEKICFEYIARGFGCSGIHNSSAAWDAPEMDAVVQAELDFGALTVSRCQQFLVF